MPATFRHPQVQRRGPQRSLCSLALRALAYRDVARAVGHSLLVSVRRHHGDSGGLRLLRAIVAYRRHCIANEGRCIPEDVPNEYGARSSQAETFRAFDVLEEHGARTSQAETLLPSPGRVPEREAMAFPACVDDDYDNDEHASAFEGSTVCDYDGPEDVVRETASDAESSLASRPW